MLYIPEVKKRENKAFGMWLTLLFLNHKIARPSKPSHSKELPAMMEMFCICTSKHSSY